MRVFPCVLAIALIAQCAIAEDNEGELLVCSALATFCHGFSMMFGIVKPPRPPPASLWYSTHSTIFSSGNQAAHLTYACHDLITSQQRRNVYQPTAIQTLSLARRFARLVQDLVKPRGKHMSIRKYKTPNLRKKERKKKEKKKKEKKERHLATRCCERANMDVRSLVLYS